MAKTVIGFFDNASDAQNAVQQLVDQGYSRDDIDMTSGNNTSDVGYKNDDTENESGITRFFKSLFGDNDEASTYSKVGSKSGSIVTVHTDSSDDAERAADLLDDCGAINVNQRAAEYGYASGNANNDMDTATGERAYASDRLNSDTDRTDVTDMDRENRYTDRANMNADRNDRTNRDEFGKERETTFQKVEENLEVGKKTVQTGGVRVRSRIVERPVEENVRLREEHVSVERNPVDRPLKDDEMANFREGDVELIERAEVPVVNKQARVVEEVRVGKEVNERNETVRDTVRNTEIDVDKLGKDDVRRDVSDVKDDVKNRDWKNDNDRPNTTLENLREDADDTTRNDI
jgi:uncharacterized protein (TIGR02271 family)